MNDSTAKNSSDRGRCRKRRKDGGQCGAMAIAGTEACRRHAGIPVAVARAKGAVVVELHRWGLTEQRDLVDPSMTLLRLLTQSATRADMLGAELRRVVEEAGDLREALVGDSWVTDADGSSRKAGEYQRALTVLEGQERDRCANFAKLAIAAGLAERTVRLAEQQGTVIASVILGVLTDLGLPAGSEEVRSLIAAHIARETGLPLTIEGEVAA